MNTDPAPPPTGPVIGSVLLGRYRVVRELAKGGMGVVYLARAEGAVGFVKPVVVKLILQEYAADERYVGMFVREARILASLRDPGIVDVLEFGEHEGNYVMVLEYVHGYHLGQWKRYLKHTARQVPTGIMLQIGIDTLQALHHAHTAKHPDGESMHIVHRDVSPSNVLLDSNGRARLLDFGVARMRDGGHGYQTQAQGFVGKDPYIAPEIFAGRDASPQSDLYACAVVLHEVLIGHNVFRAEHHAGTLHRVLNHQPEPVSAMREDVPEALDAVLDRALAKDPNARYQTAADLADALRTIQPQPEHEVRAELAELLREDFNDEMAALLRVESLAERDEAWRRGSMRPEAVDDAPEESTRVVEMDPALSPDVGSTKVVDGQGPRRKGGAGSSPGRGPAVAEEGATKVVEMDPTTGTTWDADATEVARPGAPAHGPLPVPPPMDPGHTTPTPADDSPVRETPAPPQMAYHRLMLGGLIVVAALATLALVQSSNRTPAPHQPPPRIRVVQQQMGGQQPAQKPTQPSTSGTGEHPTANPKLAAPTTIEAAGATPTTDLPKPARQRATQRRPSGPDSRSLTRAFRRQQAEVHRCFAASVASSKTQPRMDIEFSLDAKGRLQDARVLPAALGSTDLGKCVLRVARKTHFRAQGESVVFTIPVTARLVK